MDLVTSIIGGVVIFLCIGAFVYMSAKNNRREKELLRELFGLAERSNCKITRHDLWNSSLIGIDDTAHLLFFIQKANGRESSRHVDLAQVQQCRLVDQGRTVSSKDGDYKKTEQVQLVLTHRDRGREETVLEFYNDSYDSLTLLDELQLAAKWSEIIRGALSAHTR